MEITRSEVCLTSCLVFLDIQKNWRIAITFHDNALFPFIISTRNFFFTNPFNWRYTKCTNMIFLVVSDYRNNEQQITCNMYSLKNNVKVTTNVLQYVHVIL